MQKKKFLHYAILMVALCVGVGFAGCSKDSSDSLERTTWVYTESGGEWSETLEFKSNGQGVYTWVFDDPDETELLSFSDDFTYTYSSPNVVIERYDATGVVNDDKMTFTNWGEDQKIQKVFKKK